MKRFTGFVSTRKVGSECEFEFEVDDDATDDQIEDAGREAMFEQIEWNFRED
jgi:hypothetical protein